MNCHPERSEGSASCDELQIPRSARDDKVRKLRAEAPGGTCSAAPNASPNRPPANGPSAPANSLSANRLPATPNARRSYSFGSVPPSPAVARRACVLPAVSVGRRQSPATVPRSGAGGRLLRELGRAQSAPPVRSLRPREPQSSAGPHPAPARRACGVSLFHSPKSRSPRSRSPNQHPSFPSTRSPMLSVPPLAWPLLAPRAQPELVPRNSRSLPRPAAGKPLPQPGNSAKAQSPVHRQVA